MFVSNSRRAGDSYDSWEPSGIWPEKLCVETAEMEQRCATSMLVSCIASLLISVAGQVTTTTPPLVALYSPDVPMSCSPLQNCRLQGDFPNRGFCISSQRTQPDVTGQGEACWDVCNPAHNTSQYTVNGNGMSDVVNIVAEGMVAQVRAGLNNNVSCPKRLGLSDSSQTCPAGDPCPKKLRHQFKVPYGRGLCVVKGDEVKGYACFDMCDFRIPASRFSEGAHPGIALNVMNFRSSGACQSKPWLPWVIAFVVLALIAGCCGILYVQRRNRSTRRTDVMRDQEDDSYTGDHDEEDGEQEMPPFEDQPGYGRQDMYGGQPSYQQDLDAQYGMPGRASGSSQVPPMSGQFPPTAYMPDQLGTTGASVKIAGLDEPHLPMPSVGFQIPSNTAMSNVSTSGQYAMGLPLLTTPGSPQQAYTTQLPYGSPGSRAFATTLPATYTAAPAPTSGGSVRLTAPAVTVPQPYTTTYTTPQG